MNIELTVGNVPIISGGTKTAIIRSRPWQKDIENDPSRCPFCNKTQMESEGARPPRVVEKLNEPWFVVKNKYTKYSFSNLIIPLAHWDNEKLRVLGGERGVFDILSIVQAEEIECMNENGKILAGVHVGPYAGQNLSHLHIHLLSLPEVSSQKGRVSQATAMRKLWKEKPSRRVMDESGVHVLAHGVRSGQCFIFPSRPLCIHDHYARLFGSVTADLVSLFNKRFTSTEGFSPDFMLYFMFENRVLEYGTYIPILNHWGITEYEALIGESPFGLPWPHEATVQHLLQ